MEWRGVKVSLMTAAIVMLSAIFFITDDVSAETTKYEAPEISISVRLSNSCPFPSIIAPGYYKDGSVTLTGTIFCEIPWCPENEYLVCQIEIDAGNWSVKLMEPITFSRAQKQQSFTSTVTIPWDTPAGMNKTVNFYCRWYYIFDGNDSSPQGRVGPFSTQVRIPQFYYPDISAPDSLELKHGKKETMDLTVINRGNGHDRPRITITNLSDLKDNGISIQLSQDKCDLRANQSKVIPITIGIKKWAPSKEHIVEIRVISSRAEALGEISEIRSDSILIRVKGPFDLDVILPISILSIVILLAANSVFIILIIKRKLKKRSNRLGKV